MKKLLKRQLIFSFMCFMIPGILNAETFRVSKVHSISVKEEFSSESVARLGINDALAISLPEDRMFIEALELKMDIPESVAYWMDSVACSVYSTIKPTPKASQIDYTGTRAYVSTLPGKLSWVLQIPIEKENSLKSNKYTTKVDTVIEPQNNIIFIRLQPVMKGVPEETMKAIIPITVKPILKNKGLLTLNLKTASPDLQTTENLNTELKPCTVYIDDMPVDSNKKKILLDTGIHNISIISESYRNEVRTVRIDQAKNTEISVEMKSIEPTLLITAPEGTIVLLDEEECNTIGTEFVISEGDHKIKFSIGDYEMIRTISAIKGKTYTANFSLDLQISEE